MLCTNFASNLPNIKEFRKGSSNGYPSHVPFPNIFNFRKGQWSQILPGLHKQKLKTVPDWNLSKDAGPFMKISFFFRYFFKHFSYSKSITWFLHQKVFASFILPHLFCNVEFGFSWFHNTKQSSDILILEREMLLEFQNKTNIKIIWF